MTGKRSFLLSLAAVLAFALMGCEAFDEVINFEREDSFIIPYDALSPFGETVRLEAKVEYIDGLSGIRGETLVLEYDGEDVASALTDSGGLAIFEFDPPKAGDYDFTVKLAEDSARKAEEAPLMLCVREPGTRFIVTDVDKTISDASYTEFLRTEAKKIKPVKGSEDVLNDLSKRYSIIYLTAREEMFRRKTKIWMEDKDFPTGPVFFWSWNSNELSHEAYKTQLLAKLKAQWPNIVAGFGDLPGDAQAYISNDIPAFIIRRTLNPDMVKEAEERAEFPQGARFIELSWKNEEMLKELLPDED
jgi:hypothetical protein